MSLIVMNRVWDHASQSGTPLVVLLALADRADEDGICWPGVGWIAQRARLQPRQARNTLRQLEQSGDIHAAIGRGRNHTNLYLITIGLSNDEILAIYQRRKDILPAEIATPNENKPAIQRHKTGNPASKTGNPASSENRQSSVENRQSSVTKPAIAIAGDPLDPINGEIDLLIPSEINFSSASKTTTNGNGHTQHTPAAIWQMALDDLALTMPAPTYETWVRDTSVLGYEDGEFVIGVPHAYAREWLTNRLRPQVSRILSRLMHGQTNVRFDVRPR